MMTSICIITGIVIFAGGYFSEKLIRRLFPTGVLKIEKNDPYSIPQLSLELYKDIDDLSKCRTITLKVDNGNYISHKYISHK